MTDAMQVKEALADKIEASQPITMIGAAELSDIRLQPKDWQLIVAALRAPSPAALDPVTVEACAKVADVFENDQDKEATRLFGKQGEWEVRAARDIASRIAEENRALHSHPAPTGKTKIVNEILAADKAPPEASFDNVGDMLAHLNAPEPVAEREVLLALADEIEQSDGISLMLTNCTIQIGIRRTAIVVAALRAAPASNPQEAGLANALRQWKCPGCDGSGKYQQNARGRARTEAQGKTPDQKFEPDPVTCRVCNGDGLNPVASAALAARSAE